jgi:two-component system, OmpR family, response regulator MtrA
LFGYGRGGVPSRPSILYVEDDSAIADMYALGLNRAGFTLTVAGDWPAGLRLLRARHFDLVVLDVMLPGPSGMEALEAIRADPALRELPVAILSNSELTPEVHARAVHLGILGWLTKSRTPPPIVVRTFRRWLAMS